MAVEVASAAEPSPTMQMSPTQLEGGVVAMEAAAAEEPSPTIHPGPTQREGGSEGGDSSRDGSYTTVCGAQRREDGYHRAAAA